MHLINLRYNTRTTALIIGDVSVLLVFNIAANLCNDLGFQSRADPSNCQIPFVAPLGLVSPSRNPTWKLYENSHKHLEKISIVLEFWARSRQDEGHDNELQ